MTASSSAVIARLRRRSEPAMRTAPSRSMLTLAAPVEATSLHTWSKKTLFSRWSLARLNLGAEVVARSTPPGSISSNQPPDSLADATAVHR